MSNLSRDGNPNKDLKRNGRDQECCNKNEEYKERISGLEGMSVETSQIKD